MRKNTPPPSARILKRSVSEVLGQDFFARPTDIVARELLGNFLVRRRGGNEMRSIIIETEAYDGLLDSASHARFGPTKRNEPMFGPPGHWYVYFCYGVHWMLNVTTREKGYPAAILLRGVLGAPGPGRLTRHFDIDGSFSTLPVTPDSGLWIERGVVVPSSKIRTGPRIGVGYAGEWAEKPLRFYLGKEGIAGIDEL